MLSFYSGGSGPKVHTRQVGEGVRVAVMTAQQTYAKRRNYQYVFKTGNAAPEGWAVQWNKVFQLRNALPSLAGMEYIVVLDGSDYLITNPDIVLENIITEFGEEKLVYISRDPPYVYGCYFACAGFIIFRNDARLAGFLDEWIEEAATRSPSLKLDEWPLEQTALNNILEHHIAKGDIALLPYCVLQNMCGSVEELEEGKKLGNFGHHCMGSSKAVLNAYIEKKVNDVKG